MTREERLDLLKQIEKDIHVCSLESTFLDDAKSCAIHSVIEELEQEPKWIPCSERLPEKEYDNYLVSTSDDEVDIGSYGSEKGWSMCDADGFYYPRHRGIEVVAWMPLPGSYKAKAR